VAQRLISGIRIGTERLLYYFKQSHPLSDQCLYPYIASFTLNDQEIKFSYEGFLLRDNTKPLYLAKFQNGYKIVVKFCADRYGAKAHTFLAQLALAPKLYVVQEVGFMQMVIMEYVEGEQWYSPLHSVQYWDKLSDIIELYHQAGFVHGDLRAPNIIISNHGPVLLDFDWAGESGVVTYPRVLNHKDILWPEGVDINEPILPEHDIFMLKQLKASPVV
jgi:serine/threonine protein kinase